MRSRSKSHHANKIFSSNISASPPRPKNPLQVYTESTLDQQTIEAQPSPPKSLPKRRAGSLFFRSSSPNVLTAQNSDPVTPSTTSTTPRSTKLWMYDGSSSENGESKEDLQEWNSTSSNQESRITASECDPAEENTTTGTNGNGDVLPVIKKIRRDSFGEVEKNLRRGRKSSSLTGKTPPAQSTGNGNASTGITSSTGIVTGNSVPFIIQQLSLDSEMEHDEHDEIYDNTINKAMSNLSMQQRKKEQQLDSIAADLDADL